MRKNYTFEAKVWLWPGETGSWHFISLPKEESALWREKHKGIHRGWNSLKVTVTLGKTSWDTSIFFDTKSSRYLLPIKKKVRKAEDVLEGDLVKIRLVLI